MAFHPKENPANKERTKLKLNKMPLTLGEPKLCKGAPIPPDRIAAPEYI